MPTPTRCVSPRRRWIRQTPRRRPQRALPSTERGLRSSSCGPTASGWRWRPTARPPGSERRPTRHSYPWRVGRPGTVQLGRHRVVPQARRSAPLLGHRQRLLAGRRARHYPLDRGIPHRRQRWSDIGYNFIVDKFGGMWEGRDGSLLRNSIGAHAEGFNTGSVGVMARNYRRRPGRGPGHQYRRRSLEVRERRHRPRHPRRLHVGRAASLSPPARS